MYFLSLNFVSLLPIIPIILLVLLMIAFNKKKQSEADKIGKYGLGRKGRKDHLWLIIKDYLKKKEQFGSSVEVSYIFDRPSKEDLHTFLKKGLIFKTKLDAKERNEKYRKPKIPKRFEIEDYFDKLEIETEQKNKEFLYSNVKNSRGDLNFENQQRKKQPRKRYVIMFKTKTAPDEVSDWRALEVEVVRKQTRDGKNKDAVVVNMELDVEKENSWLLPLLHQRETEKQKKSEKKK